MIREMICYYGQHKFLRILKNLFDLISNDKMRLQTKEMMALKDWVNHAIVC